MKTLFKLFLLTFAVLIGLNMNAQSATSSSFGSNDGEGGLTFGVKAGVNFAGTSGKGAEDYDGKTGFNAGVFMEYTLPMNVYFMTGLDFSMKGAKFEETDGTEKYKETYSPMYLQLPIHAGYRVAITDGINVGVHFGPYLAYGIGGKSKYEYTDSDYPEDNEKEEEDFFGSEDKGGFKSFDFGLGFGADVDIDKFRVGLGYDFGLTNIGRNKDFPVKNRNFFINVGYKF